MESFENIEFDASLTSSHHIYSSTVFARSNAAATIYFIARVCAAFIREQRLLIPVAAREAILRETVD